MKRYILTVLFCLISTLSLAQTLGPEHAEDQNAHHPKLHSSAHSENGEDEVSIENLATACTSGQVVKSDGAGGLACGADSGDASATYVTTASEAGLSNEKVLGTSVIMRDTFAARPAASTGGRLYVSTDNAKVYRDNGSSWDEVTIAASVTTLPTGALTCGGGTAGQAKVHTTPLQYCDNAGTPALQYSAYGNSAGAATGVACTDCVALSTETTGNYVGTVIAGTAMAVTGSDAENASKTVALDTAASPAITGTWDFGGGKIELPNSTTLPATCGVGQAYVDTDATSGQRFYLCESTNTWVLQSGGGSGGGSSGKQLMTAAAVADADFIGVDASSDPTHLAFGVTAVADDQDASVGEDVDVDTTSQSGVPFPAGTLSKCGLSFVADDSHAETLTLYVNNVATAITCTTSAGTAGSCADTANSVAVTAGQGVAARVIKTTATVATTKALVVTCLFTAS